MTTETTIDTLNPVRARDRIATLDVLRGLAVLGILAVNAAAYGLPFGLQMAPDQTPFTMTGDNALAHWVVEVFFRQKFLTLFSMLFGVSIFLVGGERADEARGRLLRRRLFWLAVIAIIHGLALWYGDVLLLYAWAGLFVMLMRSMKASTLIAVGLGVTLLLATMQGAMGWLAAAGPEEFVRQYQANQPKLPEGAIAAIIADYQSGWAGAMSRNFNTWLMLQGMSLLAFVFSTVPLMMLGLGLFKSGFLSGRAPMWLYGVLIVLGGAVLALHGVLQWREIAAGPGVEATGGLAALVAAYPIFITLGYASAIIVLVTRGAGWLKAILAPVGQMAFTNYLAQTIIMTSIFYMPWGPRLYGQLDYVQLWGVVAAVWAIQLIWSRLWLSRFAMGPLEWVWRCLTYGRQVPLRRAAA
ncbi:MAG: DUF418 domain-containing protein [Brevundimonas sp.]|uniref:DUF418 domain-containing protein n=1 Tax=Brevundimonas sp. TaxID=1871086 RepID=UPI00121F7B44|nr:DUF418 domain-containing protein [Brevundimonas sp.]RZJ18490.1 MAG: DUF418 domain-containing protein [Brevundimonas sp.]